MGELVAVDGVVAWAGEGASEGWCCRGLFLEGFLHSLSSRDLFL